MEDSILLTVKKLIGGADSGTYNHFNEDLIVHINMCLAVVDQLIADSDKPFRITGDTERWIDIPCLNEDELAFVKDYVCLRTRLTFDPPTSSFVLDALKKTCDELEFRIMASFDPRRLE